MRLFQDNLRGAAECMSSAYCLKQVIQQSWGLPSKFKMEKKMSWEDLRVFTALEIKTSYYSE